MSEVKTKEKFRDSIFKVQEKLLEYDQVEMDLLHHFSKGLYARELRIPKGTLVVGKIHKFESLNILVEGELVLLTENGKEKIKSPYIMVSQPGIKRMVFTHTDCVWLTVHGTDKKDLEEIEEDVIAKDYDEVEELPSDDKEALCHGQ